MWEIWQGTLMEEREGEQKKGGTYNMQSGFCKYVRIPVSFHRQPIASPVQKGCCSLGQEPEEPSWLLWLNPRRKEKLKKK